MNYDDLTWKKFGKLTVIKMAEKGKHGNMRWICKCECGNITKPIFAGNLKRGLTLSCGCYHNSKFLELVEKTKTHGMSSTRLYDIWIFMKHRCNNPNSRSYKDYGGRGIKVCEEWQNSFESFYKWSIENGYDDKLTIDRIDVNGNYCPENCRWATKKEQANNTRNNRMITAFGKTMTMHQWADYSGIRYQTIYRRLKDGWNEADAVSLSTNSTSIKKKTMIPVIQAGSNLI